MKNLFWFWLVDWAWPMTGVTMLFSSTFMETNIKIKISFWVPRLSLNSGAVQVLKILSDRTSSENCKLFPMTLTPSWTRSGLFYSWRSVSITRFYHIISDHNEYLTKYHTLTEYVRSRKIEYYWYELRSFYARWYNFETLTQNRTISVRHP